MNAKNVNNKSLTQTIRDLELGQKIFYPLERFNSVRSICCTIAYTLRQKYKTSVDRENGTISVTRIK
jgi:hypothetical protein